MDGDFVTVARVIRKCCVIFSLHVPDFLLLSAPSLSPLDGSKGSGMELTLNNNLWEGGMLAGWMKKRLVKRTQKKVSATASDARAVY
jgi:hypothetical protein